MVSFWDRVGRNVSGAARAGYDLIDRTLAGGALPGGYPNQQQLLERTQWQPGPTARMNSMRNRGPVEDSPWRPGGPRENESVRGGGTTRTVPTGGTSPVFGGSGGGAFGGGGFSFTMPAFEMPSINIPTYQPPKPPKVKKLTFKQLNSLIKSDPGLLEEKAGIREDFQNARSQLNAARKRNELGEVEDLRRLDLAEAAARRDITGQLSSMGAGAGIGTGAATWRAQNSASFQRQESDLERQYEELFADIESQLASAKTQKERNLATAKQNAINRYLSTRTQPTEIVY